MTGELAGVLLAGGLLAGGMLWAAWLLVRGARRAEEREDRINRVHGRGERWRD